jgi:hypothetical protein
MSFYPAVAPDVTLAAADQAGLALLGRAGVVAVRARDLACPAGPAGDGRTALTAAGAGKIRAGDVVVFCKVVAVAPAVTCSSPPRC